MSTPAYTAHVAACTRDHAQPLTYSEWVYLAVRCIAKNCREYEQSLINR